MGDMSDDADIIDNGPGVVDVPWDNVETGSKYKKESIWFLAFTIS